MPKIKEPTKPRLFVGIDPGKQGGIASVLESNSELLVEYYPMPDKLWQVWATIQGLQDGRTPFIVLEQVHSMPNQSAQSGFTFGRGVGNLEMAIVASKIAYDEVPPQRWMKALGIPTVKGSTPTQRKEALRKKCQMLFPDLMLWQETKKLQLSVCDAILIAEYARRTY